MTVKTMVSILVSPGIMLLGILLPGISATGAMAADALPAAASFSVTYTFTTSTPATPIDVGNGRDLIVNEYLATMVNNEGRGFLHLTAGRCTNIRFTNRSERTIDTNAYCNFKDRDGDIIYAQYTTGTPKALNAIKNSWRFTSGTGKYSGITGKAEDSYSNNLDTQGSYQAAGTLNGSYVIKPPTPAN